jgi:FAD/FMN-containing dehydrogenase
MARQDWRALDDAIERDVVLPSRAEYGAAKNLFNRRFANSTPAAVVTVTSTDDVQKAVAFAAKAAARSPPVAAGTPTSELRLQTAPWSSTYVSCPATSPTTKAVGS